MKIVFLNALHAQITTPLRAFLLAHRDSADVFCFQEADEAMEALIEEVLPGFTQVSARKQEPGRGDFFYNVTLVRAALPIEATSSNDTSAQLGLALATSVRHNGALVHIVNVHGITRPGKLDFPERLEQSQEILSTMEAREGAHVVGGDFNVLPETKSVQIFEEAGYRNLIKEYNIKTTRNHLVWDKYPGNELNYSDYVFVKGAEVALFEVPQEIVSDHQPMIVVLK